MSTIDTNISRTILNMALIKKTTYKDQVVAHVYELILDGRHAPGDQIKESLLAKELGISRAPVREAMKELIGLGIVDYKPQVGNFIAQLTARQIVDAYVTRGVLEAYAVMTTWQLFKENDFVALQALVSRMRDYARQGDKKMVVQVGDEFHASLVNKNTNILLSEYMNRLSLKLHVMFCKHWSDLYSTEEIGDRHLRIVTSIMTGNPGVIEATIREHYSESGNKIAALYQYNGLEFEA